jgi:hypothetical protein
MVPSTVAEPFTTNFSAQDDHLVVGNAEHYLRIDLEPAREVPAGVTLSIAHDLPAGSPARVWHFYSNLPRRWCLSEYRRYRYGQLRLLATRGHLGVSGTENSHRSSGSSGPRVPRVMISQIIYGPA